MPSDRKKLFGTDGVRGRVGQFPITPEIALRLGQALGLLLKEKYPDEKRHTALIGKDTRLSGYMLEQALAAGLNSTGVWVQLTGPLPTPGIGFLAQNMRVSAGAVISASHNPYYDNGIKIFFSDGFKISSQEESRIEELVFSNQLESRLSPPDQVGRTRRIVDSAGRYIVFAKNSFPKDKDLKNIKMILDCANGSAYKVAPAIFEELGAKVITLNNRPDGFNINKNAGALHPERTAEKVREHKADLGVSLDGDGDRLIMLDEKGAILNGNHITGICALALQKQNRLPGGLVAATRLTNSGLEESLKTQGLTLVRTEVGDRNLVETMRAKGIALGGEPSGHIVFLENSTTGDGCIAALNVLSVMKQTGQKLSQLRELIKEKPQAQENARANKKREFLKVPGYNELIRSVERQVEGCRVLVRPSGTEPLVRVFVEGDDPTLVKQKALEIKTFLEKHLS